jgi:hypothetical protein
MARRLLRCLWLAQAQSNEDQRFVSLFADLIWHLVNGKANGDGKDTKCLKGVVLGSTDTPDPGRNLGEVQLSLQSGILVVPAPGEALCLCYDGEMVLAARKDE